MTRKPQKQKRKKPKHRGSIRTRGRVDYLIAGLSAALADSEVCGHVALVGDLFARSRGRKVTAEQLARVLAARHPKTGKLLRSRVNTGTRREGESRVSNVCHGFDIGLSVAKSVSVSALLFGDDTVMNASFEAMRHTAQWLTRQMDRRLRKGGQNATVATGKSAAFVLPEKTGRDGQPHLHAHVIIPNLTIMEEAGRQKYCAGHFRRITRLALTAQRRMNSRLFRRLHKAGYAVNMVEGVCHLPSVSEELCDRLSPVRGKLEAMSKREGSHPRKERIGRAKAGRRDADYLTVRSNKELRTLAQWREHWGRDLSSDLVKDHAVAYVAHRMRDLGTPVSSPNPVEVSPMDQNDAQPAIAAHRIVPAIDEALENTTFCRPTFRDLGASVRKRVQDEAPVAPKAQVAELIYSCPEQQTDLVEHTEALRTLLRLIFPRLIIHQQFKKAGDATFVVRGAVTADQVLSKLVVEAAAALNAELQDNASIRQNWPAVLRWLHGELACQPPAPLPSPRRASKVPRAQPRIDKPVPVVRPAVSRPLGPVPPVAPVSESEPEIEMLP